MPCGLLVHGTVVKRTRRYITNKKNERIEIVTYIVQGDDKKKYFVDEYAPEKYFDNNALVTIPVYIKTYQKKIGGVGYTLNVEKEFSYLTVGEDF